MSQDIGYHEVLLVLQPEQLRRPVYDNCRRAFPCKLKLRCLFVHGIHIPKRSDPTPLPMLMQASEDILTPAQAPSKVPGASKSAGSEDGTLSLLRLFRNPIGLDCGCFFFAITYSCHSRKLHCELLGFRAEFCQEAHACMTTVHNTHSQPHVHYTR
jgi:hypothetical protein